MSQPQLSVVIPTYNRKALLTSILDTLSEVKCVPNEMEVVVVDDGSCDGTEEMLLARQDSFPLRIMRHEQPQGPSVARNKGVAAAHGTILGFLDSDVLVDTQWWQAAKEYFNDPKVAVVEGATLPPMGSEPPTPFSHFVSNQRGNSFQTCNLFCRKEVFQEVGGFDERFSWKARNNKIWHVREDTDLAFSILEKGYLILFAPQAIAYHPIFSASRMVYFHKTYHGPYEILLRRKHPKLYQEHLNWIDGREFPVFYWGIYLGLPLVVAALIGNVWLLALLGAGMFSLGWAGAVYAVCRKRKVSIGDALILGVQFLMIPWFRLFWVLVGAVKFRNIKPEDIHRRDAENAEKNK
jgi:glycosyltransferase involved in cell wall biosynthesis